jgi:hypothetical protein
MGANGVVDLPGLMQGDRIGEADDGPAALLDIGLPQLIPQHDVRQPVHPTVDLDHKLQRLAGEVGDIGPDRMLTPEPEAIEASSPQSCPDPPLRQPRRLP